MSDLKEIKSRILSSARAAQANGIKITNELWGICFRNDQWEISGNCCCPLAAVLSGNFQCHDYVDDLANILGRDRAFVDNFIMGFDYGLTQNQVQKLGREVGEELNFDYSQAHYREDCFGGPAFKKRAFKK